MNVVEGQRYVHKTKSMEVTVLHIARMHTDETACVVYHQHGIGESVVVRPLDEFKVKFERKK